MSRHDVGVVSNANLAAQVIPTYGTVDAIVDGRRYELVLEGAQDRVALQSLAEVRGSTINGVSPVQFSGIDSSNVEATFEAEEFLRLVAAGRLPGTGLGLGEATDAATMEAASQLSARNQAVVNAYNQGISNQVKALKEAYDEGVKTRAREAVDREFQYEMDKLWQGVANDGMLTDIAIQQAYNAIGGVQENKQFAAEALARTLEGFEVQQAGTFRDYSLGTQASRTQLNRLTGVGSPIAEFTQDVRREQREEQEALEDLAERNAKAAERQQQAAYDRRIYDYQLGIQGLEAQRNAAQESALLKAAYASQTHDAFWDNERSRDALESDIQALMGQVRQYDDEITARRAQFPGAAPPPAPIPGVGSGNSSDSSSAGSFNPLLWGPQ